MKRFIIAHIQDWRFTPFWILEYYDTVDGARSRITDKRFATLQDARDWIEEVERHTEAPVTEFDGTA